MKEKWTVHNIRVIPGSKLNQVVGWMEDGSLKIKLKVKPIAGRANLELIKYLSNILDINESDIEIHSGLSSRNKIIRIRNVDKARLQQKILG